MRVYMNTFKNIGEHTDIHNLPLNKWFHVVIAVRQRYLDVYINGNLAKRHTLSIIPNKTSVISILMHSEVSRLSF